jgi:signal transduction histidine kinase
VTRRITTAIVGVTAFVLLALGVPLAVVAQRQILDSEVVELQATAARTLTEIAIPLDKAELAEVADEPDRPPPFTVYELDGRRFFGDGPVDVETVVISALAGQPSSSTAGQIVVTTPITDQNENVVGALRLSEPLSGSDARARRAWAVMALAGAVAIAIAWLIASRLARRLSLPVTDLAAAAARLGDGGVLARHEPVGVAEIDLLATTLVEGSHRVSEALARERRFSADVSHQLRNPLAALRLKLEAAVSNDQGAAAAQSALGDLDRIDSTVAHLLAFARDNVPASATCSLSAAAEAALARWAPIARDAGRTLTVVQTGEVSVRANPASVDQILDVVVDNALTHGRGDVSVTVRAMAGGGAIDVRDEGSIDDSVSDDDVFRRGHGTNHGIGLALARAMAEAEGGRLMLRRRPTVLSLVLLDTEPREAPGTRSSSP